MMGIRGLLRVLLFGAWSIARLAQAQSSGAVGIWGSMCNSNPPVPATAHSNVVAIASGPHHTIALKDNGSIIWWGECDQDQTPVPAEAQNEVVAIAAGGLQAAALKNNGAVVAWGYNEYGQFPVPDAAQSGVTAIAVGGSHIVGLKGGSVIAWGHNGSGQATVPAEAQNGVVAVAAGRYHTVALRHDGSVVAWGYNGFGQTTVPIAAQSEVTAIAAGDFYTLALKSDGSVLAWGWAGLNQATIPLEAQNGVKAIAAGTFHAAALKDDGSVVIWNADGKMNVPAGLSGVMAIGAGRDRTVVLVTPTAPQIIVQPASQTVHIGQKASFMVSGTGLPFTYQWRRDGVDLAKETMISHGYYDPVNNVTNFVSIELPMDSTYTLPSVQSSNAGIYTVVLNNSAGSVTSAPAFLMVEPVAVRSTLNADPTGNTLIVSWPVTAAGFSLQSSEDFMSWTDYPTVPGIIGSSFTVTNAVSSTAQFFRLRKL